MPDLAALLAKNLIRYGGDIGVRDCTLIKVTPGTRTSGNLGRGTNPVETPVAASGWIESYGSDELASTPDVSVSDRKISILGASIATDGVTPTSGDKITIVDIDGVSKTFRIVSDVTGDGVGAVFVCQGRV